MPRIYRAMTVQGGKPMVTAEKSPHYARYVELLSQLHALLREGKGDTAEADALRDQMDEPWSHLTEQEIAQARLLSAKMSSQNASTASVWAPAEPPRVPSPRSQ